jgi:SAM-dependent methyltransferase
MTRTQSMIRLLLLSSCALLASCKTSQPTPSHAPVVDEPSVKPGINDGFLGADVDVDRYIGIFEGESREIAVHRDAIVAALNIEGGAEIADVGAGTGLFLGAFAGAVGPQGKLYAVDLAPDFIAHMSKRIERDGFQQVELVQCSERSAELAPASVDLIFVCDTYHHFEYPQSTLASLHSALRAGGSLVVVDFDRIPGETADWLLEHVRAGKEVFRAEIEAAGFEFERELDVAGLKENYVLRFKRAE